MSMLNEYVMGESNMKFRKDDLFGDCLGAVTILTESNVVFQGQIRREREEERKCEHATPQVNVVVEDENENPFILLELRCDAAIIDDGRIQSINPPLFREDDVVRINIANIVALGPSSGCFDDDEDTGTGGTGGTSGTGGNTGGNNKKG
jgi:hypothetical protein